MSTINLRRYSEPGTLKEFSPATLLAILGDDREFLAKRKVHLPVSASRPEDIDYAALARAFLSPDDIPPRLVERLHLIAQLATKDAMDRILEVVLERKIPVTFAPNSSPADVAGQLLLQDALLFRAVHAEMSVENQRSFIHFVAAKRPRTFTVPADLAPVEGTLNEWYMRHHRGRSAHVMWRKKNAEFWFMVRHADPVKRDGCVDLTDYSSGSTMYRPERHDLVVYDSENGELRIHADNKLEPELFRTAFGEHIFGNRDFFPLGKAKYTLEPLKTLGRKLFDAPGVEGVVRAWFREVEFERFGKLREREIHKSDDLFTAFAARGFVIPEDPSIHVRRAKFAVQFTDSKRPRMVTVRPSNYAQFGRDDDAIIVGKLLDRLGLISKDEPADAEQDGSVENH